MLNCDKCKNEFYHLTLDIDENNKDVFLCYECRIKMQNSYNINMKRYNHEAAKQFSKNHKGQEREISKCNECYKDKIIVVDIQDRKYCNHCWDMKRVEFIKNSGGINWQKK